ncbi:hypothetical protein BATDEDRAFT_86971 [Batrachochytrium dendrobatidis JAM81]|uniref:DUF8032 domain-containing protein n=2 Tax=Batrachochytrium dendrobatidis TaxID=109871 RepID=F4NXW1_BATDJ|nr:uncharacterized protein BATDEDRAFT_86971 [Batrachochytrium dendrobatidis JAM81]EGF82209.1 hypothetical protein BATDEDRAFT_86971 [Batrachochytrium dendrobatidis JAM81]KAJ8324477.1 hypothetical protein O5D80_006728 [Batrachochytrium dendrobatidis]KAK5670724.1 hypothetical protein QVD99_002500 [Batrachochytrium dendrobatidis]OAJ40606.1 hypothetical protein BDEG_24317 [Batrachochytrium dendrobatidis JEL423]|eukprot:XP_006677669.1 hypothetical protein BATDEDRAFT_86971 [Batrachochytrium dendrobatidis JAM81]
MAGSTASRNQRKRPLTIPNALETIQGVEWLTFTYTSRGMGTQYTIRIDIDSVDNDDLTSDFKVTNSVYPRANVPQDEYAGNRWQYESTVNEIGWRLAYLNFELIAKRGLLQRAVDSFRNRFPDMKSRRVARVEKHETTETAKGARRASRDPPVVTLPKKPPPALVEALLARPPSQPRNSTKPAIATEESDYDESLDQPARKRTRRSVKSEALPSSPASQSKSQTIPISTYSSKLTTPTLTTLMLETIRDNAPWRLEIRIDQSVMTSQPSAHFKEHYALYRHILPKNSNTATLKLGRELLCNDIAWRLAFLNPESLGRSRSLLQRAVDMYLELYGDARYRSRPALRMIQDSPQI